LFKISSSLFPHGNVGQSTSLAFADIVLVTPRVMRTKTGFPMFVFSGTGPAADDLVFVEQGIVHEYQVVCGFVLVEAKFWMRRDIDLPMI
jgi:hypothetical protein